MPQTYGTILSSTPERITRLVVIDGDVTLQVLTIAQEVTLDPGEVSHMLRALGQDPAMYQDPILQRLLATETPVPPFGGLPPLPLGPICACDGQAGVHVATVACSTFLREGA